jgi:hypothetical protein
MLKRALLLVVAFAFMCVPAMAGDRPEFDCVGDDSANFFNDFIKEMVVANNPWNDLSNFLNIPAPDPDCDECDPPEPYEFFTNPTQITDDDCFPGYLSSRTGRRQVRIYEWQIVLQMDPQSDLNINIVDCVLKENSSVVFGEQSGAGCEQTGRYTMPSGRPVFNILANPRMTAEAIPGEFAVAGFEDPFYLVNRTLGGLNLLEFRALLYTSKCIWEEGLVARMPEWRRLNLSGQWEYPLSAGDKIKIEVQTSPFSPVDIRYGADNVCVKYIGVNGSVYEGDP